MVSQAQLYELDWGEKQIRRMVHNGHLLPIQQNVYALGHTGLVPRAYLLAAQLSLGPRCFLSHRTAAAIHGLRAVNRYEIDVTVVGGVTRRGPGLTVHRTRTEPHPKDVRQHGVFRVSSVLRMLCESAAREGAAELERLVTEAVRHQLLRPEARDGRQDIEDALARHEPYRGMRRLRAVFARYTRVTDGKSGLERDFDAFLAQHPEIPDPEPNVYIGPWEIDRFWRAHSLAVELDGRPYHVSVKDMEKDRLKDAALLRLGITPLRFTDFRFEQDQGGILGDLYHFLKIAA